MKRLLVSAFALAAIATTTAAQVNVVSMTQLNGDLSVACSAGNITYALLQVRDAASATDCATGSGDGTTPSICWCVDGSFVAIASDLSGYAPLAGADFTGDVTITGGTLTVEGCTDFGPLADYSSITGSECDRFFDTTLHVPCFYLASFVGFVRVDDPTTGCTSGGD